MTRDPQIWAEARQRLPLPDLLSLLGDGQYREKKALCPFCAAKGGKWGLFKRGGRDFFKCHTPECVANDPESGNSEIGYLALRKGLDSKEAAKEFLRLAFPERAFDDAPEPEAKPAKSAPPPPHPATEGQPKNVWHDLWRRLPLTAEDHATLKVKRGFSDETIRLHGIRSNKFACKAIAEALADDWPLSLLLGTGLYKEEGRAAPSPSGQFYGYGITGEKDENGKPIFAITEPPIIPYFNAAGVPFYLRPHKGGVKRPRTELSEVQLFEDEDDEATCAAEVFIPIGTAELVELADGKCILTEGEFKAIAGTQAGVPIIAAPGVSFIRNPEFRRKLEAALDQLGVTDLCIIFDNEVKNDPTFPRKYKPDPWNQWDTQVYAEYSMRELRGFFSRVNGSVRVGSLPDALRVDGKADFDGILAQCVARDGLAAGTKAARKIFRRAMEDSTGAPTSELFPSESRRIIECKVERMFHRPRVPSGDKREMELARRFAAFDPETSSVIDKDLATAFEETLGCYYLRKSPDKDARIALGKLKDDLKKRIEELEGELKSAEEAASKLRADKAPDHRSTVILPDGRTAAAVRSTLRILYGRMAATWERLKGVPVAISTFTMSCEYKLHTSGDIVDRLVRITRRRSGRKITEKKLRRITPSDLARLADFRKWGIGLGDANFGGSGGGGDKDLQDLTIDMDHHSYLRDIHELDTYGLHAESGIWFFHDCAFIWNPDSKRTTIIHADKSGIFWHEGTGYQFAVSAGDDPAEAFCQGAPRLLTSQDKSSRPSNLAWVKALRTALAEDVTQHREALTLADAMLNQTQPADCQTILDASPPASHAALRGALCSGIFTGASEDFYNTIGDHDGWTIIGMMLAYAVGPELCRQGGHPGLWFTGKMSSGKTTIGRWAMRFWGFKELGGVKLGQKSSTAVGLNRGLTQYSSLPLLLDEYRQDTIEPEKEEALRGAFDRSGGLKGIADASKKTRNPIAKTTPIVMGESSSKDGATRSRYAQIHVSIHQRIGDGSARYPRIQNDCKHYFHLGRWVMENRAAFAERALDILDNWNQSQTVRSNIPNDRVRLVYGVAFACYIAAGQMLGAISNTQLTEYQNFLLTHGKQGLADVVEESFLARFWSDVITARQRGAYIDKKYFSYKWVTADDKGALHSIADGTLINCPGAGAFRVIYVGAAPAFAGYLAYKASIREIAPLSEGDVRRELQKEPYFIAAPNDANRVHRIRLGGTKTTCWVLNMERHPSTHPDQPEENRPYICPFAEDLINVLTPERDASEEM